MLSAATRVDRNRKMQELENKLDSIRAELDDLYRQRRHASRMGRPLRDQAGVQRRLNDLEELEQLLRHQLWDLMIRE